MKIYTEVVYQMTAEGMEEISSKSYEYEGPVAQAGGGGAGSSQGQFNDNGRINLTDNTPIPSVGLSDGILKPVDLGTTFQGVSTKADAMAAGAASAEENAQYSYDPVTGFIHHDNYRNPLLQVARVTEQGQKDLNAQGSVIRPDDKRYNDLRDRFVNEFKEKGVGQDFLLGTGDNTGFTSFAGLTTGQNKLTDNVDKLTSQYSDLSTGLTNMDTKYGELNTGLTDLTSQFQDLGGQVENYQNDFSQFRDAYDNQLSDYSTRFENLSQGIGSLNSDYEDMQQTMNNFQENTADFSQAVIDRFGNVEGRVGTLEDKVNVNPYYGMNSFSNTYSTGANLGGYSQPLNFGTGYNIGGYNSTGYYSPYGSWLGGLGY